ncbi:MAG: hypothetical protein AAFM91_08615 [Pseudomonadota bacterium]
MISSSEQWSKLRDRLFNPALREFGFVGSRAELQHVRRAEQIHFVRSQFYVDGSVNLGIGIHFRDMPPFRFAAWPGSVGPNKLCFESSFLKRRSRLGLAGDAVSNEQAVVREADRLVEDLNSAGDLCGDGTELLALFPPDMIEPDLDRIPLNQTANLVFSGWYPNLGALIVALATKSQAIGNEQLSDEYLELASAYRDFLRPNLAEFESAVSQLRRK